MNTGTILIVVIPIGIIVFAAAIFALIALRNNKTKKKIRLLLEEQKQMDFRFNNISIIEQLRQGNALNVTDEDVRTEMKKRKAKCDLLTYNSNIKIDT